MENVIPFARPSHLDSPRKRIAGVRGQLVQFHTAEQRLAFIARVITRPENQALGLALARAHAERKERNANR